MAAGTSPRPIRRASFPAEEPRPTPSQRFLFVVALGVLTLASLYAALGTLTRAYPAVFPGSTAPLANVVGALPGPVGVSAPGSQSVFNRRINLLVIGIDRRPGYELLDAYRTDAIMVATIDPVTKQAALLSFPRDMWVKIKLPDGQIVEDRINTSYGRGIEYGGTFEAGARQLASDLEFNFGVSIDHWVILDFEGAEALVDALGGIEVDVPEELAVPTWRYSKDDIHYTDVTIPPGRNFLDGYHAVAFGRYRNDTDLNRVKRQELVLQAALRKAFATGLLDKALDLYNAYKGMVVTDIPAAKIPGYALLLKQTGGDIATYSLGDPVDGVPTLVPYTTEAGAAVLIPNPDNVRYWLNVVFPKTSYVGAHVEIQNGYGPGGEARVEALGRYLRYVKGLPEVYLGPASAPQPSTTVTLYSPEKRELAEDIAEWLNLPPSAIRTAQRTDSTLPDVVITIGQDFTLPGG
ncbi:Transcriptional regulator LytR [bacterium HR29]|jgi:LCP family protein required for cell wall assembly|nr:Transcriptional regulator LytR [bacterium HR29]